MKIQKKIIHLITSLGNGGAEKNLIRLCLLDKKNENIIVTLKKNNFYLKKLKKHGIVVLNLNILNNPISGLKKLISIIKIKKPEIIIGWMYHSCFIIVLISKFIDSKIKKIWNIRHSSVVIFKTKILTYFLVRFILVLFSNLPNLIVFNSFYSQKVHISYGFKNQNMNVIHNGFKKKKLKKKKINNILSFGFIGRYSLQKNFSFLFKIIDYLKKKKLNFKFYLLGSNVNDKNQDLLNNIQRYDIEDKIIFLKTKTDISNYFNLFDATISTSIYGESFPNILAESLMSSTPCIAVDFGENKLILKKGGFIYKKNDIDDFYKNLKKFISLRKNKKNYNYFIRQGYNHINYKFSDTKMLLKYFKIYKN